MDYDKIDVQLETLTPVHIGSAQEEMKMDIDFVNFFEEELLAVLDTNKLFSILHHDQAADWQSVVDKEEGFLSFLKQYCKKLDPYDIAKRLIETKGETIIKSFKEHVHSRKELIIPGSSLKGAVRTQFLSELIKRNPAFVQNPQHLQKKNRAKVAFSDEQIQAHYLGGKDRRNRHDAKFDIFKFLRIGDVHFETNERSRLYKSEIINLQRDSWIVKTRQSCYLECIPTGWKATGSWQIPKKLLAYAKKTSGFNSNLKLLSMESLLEIINEHTLRLIEYEIDFWKDEGNPRAIGDYLDYLEGLIKSCGKKAAVLRVGANAGWDFMTGSWAKEDPWAVGKEDLLDVDTWEAIKVASRRTNKYPDGLMFPKTRKLLYGGIPAGFVKIEIE